MTTDESMQNLCYEYPKDGKIEPYIFISYSHKDSDLVLPIIKRLHEDGYRLLFDAEVHSQWTDDIVDHLYDATQFVVFLSQNSIHSEYVKDEIATANKRCSHYMFPVLCNLNEADLPSDLCMQFSRYDYKDIKNYDGLKRALGDICLQPVTISTQQQYVNERSNDRSKASSDLNKLFVEISKIDDETRKLYRRALIGDAKAQNSLAYCYLYGTGVAKDPQQAIYWFKKAAGQGNEDAKETSPNKGGAKNVILPPEVIDALRLGMELAEDHKPLTISMIQRKLGFSYPTAAKIYDIIDVLGYIVQDADDPKKRIVNITEEEITALENASDDSED